MPSRPPETERLTASQRRELIRRERATQRLLITEYGHAFRNIQQELRALDDLIATALGKGEDAGRWLARQHQLEEWLASAHDQLARFVLTADQHIRSLAEHATVQARGDAPALIRAALGPAPAHVETAVVFAAPPPEVVATIVRNTGEGRPLTDLLERAASEGAGNARRTLIQGVLRGKGPRQLARALRPALAVTPQRALLIARTEMIRAYRQTTQATYQANRSVVQAWSWQCTFDNRTCAACWAMSGEVFPVTQSLDSHPGCRCTMVPQTASWQDLGFEGVPDSRPPIRKGTDVFDALPSTDQRIILGPAKYEAYQSGQITLKDLVHETRSPVWGKGRREASLRQALAA